MCLAAATASSPARCLSPSSAALPRRFLRGLLGAPPGPGPASARPSPPLLRRCFPFHRMAQYWAQASLDKNKALVDYLKQYDGRLGFPDAAPYDAIHVGAAAPEIPQPLLDQLKPGGRMVIPVGTYLQDLQVVDKNADGSISVRNDTSVRYVPLTSRSAQLQDP
nr:unnamed protein product [Digitaria exilis]